jgi:anti-anti-sigma factor
MNMASNSSVAYRRSKTSGTLKLQGCIDIFEAASLAESARKATSDLEIQSLHIDMSHADRLDASALQILTAIRREVAAKGVTLRLTPPDSKHVSRLAEAGCDYFVQIPG